MPKHYFLTASLLLLFFAAKAQVDNITKVTLTFSQESGNTVTVTATDTGNGLQVNGNISLMESTDYTLAVKLENGSTDITSQVNTNANRYQLFFLPMGSVLNGDVEATDTDNQGLSLGLSNEFSTECTPEGNVSGSLRAALIDLGENKSASSTIDDGTALFDLSWPITIVDDPQAPPCENEEEIITDVILTWTPDNGGEAVIASAQDPDGQGPLDLQISGPINLEENTTYTMTIQVRNEIEGDDITEEIRKEDDAHLFFFAWTAGIFSDPTGNGNADNRSDAVNYNDLDENNLPVGLSTTWTTSGPNQSGTFRLILKHQPNNKSTTSTINDGGTDLDLTWDLNTIAAITDIDQRIAINKELRIFPNPAREVLNYQINNTNAQPELVRLLDQYGRVVATYSSAENWINIQNLPKGNYFLQAIDRKQVWTKCFIKL